MILDTNVMKKIIPLRHEAGKGKCYFGRSCGGLGAYPPLPANGSKSLAGIPGATVPFNDLYKMSPKRSLAFFRLYALD
jgi:hypothetical protein